MLTIHPPFDNPVPRRNTTRCPYRARWLIILLASALLAQPPAAQAAPSRMAAAVPWAVVQPNYEVQVVATGFHRFSIAGEHCLRAQPGG